MSELSKRFKVGLCGRFYVCPLYDEAGEEVYHLNTAIELAKVKFPGKPCEVFNDEISEKLFYIRGTKDLC
jgi:hypothetical protein